MEGGLEFQVDSVIAPATADRRGLRVLDFYGSFPRIKIRRHCYL